MCAWEKTEGITSTARHIFRVVTFVSGSYGWVDIGRCVCMAEMGGQREKVSEGRVERGIFKSVFRKDTKWLVYIVSGGLLG